METDEFSLISQNLTNKLCSQIDYSIHLLDELEKDLHNIPSSKNIRIFVFNMKRLCFVERFL